MGGVLVSDISERVSGTSQSMTSACISLARTYLSRHSCKGSYEIQAQLDTLVLQVKLGLRYCGERENEFEVGSLSNRY